MSTKSVMLHLTLGVLLGLIIAPVGILLKMTPTLGFDFFARGLLAYLTVAQYAVAAMVLYHKGISDEDDLISQIIFLATLGFNSFLTISFSTLVLLNYSLPLLELSASFLAYTLLTQCTLLTYMAVSRVFDFFNQISTAAGKQVRARFFKASRQSLPQRLERTSKHDLSLLAHLQDEPESLDVEIVDDEELVNADLRPKPAPKEAETADPVPFSFKATTLEGPPDLQSNLPAVVN